MIHMETFGMKRVIILAWVLFAVIASTSVFAALEDARFKGATFDGYAFDKALAAPVTPATLYILY
jgi:hypothetical protein